MEGLLVLLFIPVMLLAIAAPGFVYYNNKVRKAKRGLITFTFDTVKTKDMFNIDEANILIRNHTDIAIPHFESVLGIKIDTKTVEKHLEELECHVKMGLLKHPNEAFGQADVDNDGKIEKFIGFAYSKSSMEIGIIDSMMSGDKINIPKTALRYEYQNTLIRAFAGSRVSLAENFVDVNDKMYHKFLGVSTPEEVQELKDKRAKLDEVFKL